MIATLMWNAVLKIWASVMNTADLRHPVIFILQFHTGLPQKYSYLSHDINDKALTRIYSDINKHENELVSYEVKLAKVQNEYSATASKLNSVTTNYNKLI